ncbi:protein Aster-C [Heterodontus francisci]|uniref:protein Aster-C n=1 Tax=Heterodontus francisci TaxID=7792 RepID=UPI00355BA739
MEMDSQPLTPCHGQHLSAMAVNIDEQLSNFNSSLNLECQNKDSDKIRLASAYDWSTDWSFWLQISSPTYKQKNDEFRKQFKDLPESEILMVDHACALQKDLLLQGRLYLTENWLCFHSNIFGWETSITISLKEITSMTKEKTARLIPNAIQICTATDKLYFTSLTTREEAYLSIFRMWQNTLLDKHLSKTELLSMVQQNYGTDLGLRRDEMDNLQLSNDDFHFVGIVGKNTCNDDNDKEDQPNESKTIWTDAHAQDSSTPLPFGDTTFINPSVVNQANTPTMPHREEVRAENQEKSHPLTTSERKNSRVGTKSPSSCLDHNGNKDLPTERTDTSNVANDAEEKTSCSDLQGKLYINRVFNMNADKMFEILFTDSQFVRKFINARKITDLVSDPWEKEVSGHQIRTLKYIITITNPLIGKFSTATEKQTLCKESQYGQYYLIDAEVITHDVPYHDYFYTLNRYCIIQTSKRKCRLRVSTDVRYRKQPWSLVKSFIEKNSWSGLEDYFKHLESDLLIEEALHNPISTELGQPGLRRRRRGYSRSHADQFTSLAPHLDADAREVYADRGNNLENKPVIQNWNLSKLVLTMSAILFILALLNLGLFFKLLNMEDVAQKVQLSNKMRTSEKLSISLDQEVMTKQEAKQKNNAERQQLRTVINDSILLLEQLKRSLAAIQKSFELRNQTVKTPADRTTKNPSIVEK